LCLGGTPVRDSLWSLGFRQDEDAMVRQRNPADIDKELVYEYPSHIFIPFLANLRTVETISSDLVICLMDSERLHVSERSLSLFAGDCVIEELSRTR
jgi:hypothetical protein